MHVRFSKAGCTRLCLRLAEGCAVLLSLLPQPAFQDGKDALDADADANRRHILAAEHAHQAVVPAPINPPPQH